MTPPSRCWTRCIGLVAGLLVVLAATVAAPGAAAQSSDATPVFDDLDHSPHRQAVEALADRGIVRGCSTTSFCPDATVTRAQAASLIHRILGSDEPAGDAFRDDDGSMHESAIDDLAARGIVRGCDTVLFCPDDPVTRAQAAALLVRAFGLAPADDPAPFDDVAGTTHAEEIAALVEADITDGCAPRRYCPRDALTRAQLASLLARKLGLTTAPDEPSTLLGVAAPGVPHETGELDDFVDAARRAPDIVMWYTGWLRDDFDAASVQRIADRGATPMITWEPYDHREGTDQPTFRLRHIADGTHDDYIRSWARGAAAWGDDLLLRFAHEMNGDWYPWSEQRNDNRPGDYVAAWRHVHDIFDEVGADNVSWVWSPQARHEGTAPLDGLYPGDTYVDWVGLDRYNGGTALPWGGWQSFDQLFHSGLAEVDAVAPAKPIMIAETASAEAGGDKAAWIEGMLAAVRADPRIRAIVWFNYDKETDWRVQSSESARRAFATGVAELR